MQITPSDATLGAVVTGVDLTRLDDAVFAEIESAWHRYAVLVFEGQDLSTEAQLAFSRRIGRLERGLVKSSTRLLAHISNTLKNGDVADPASLQVRFNEGNQHWHSDSSYKRVGAKASLLCARVVPDTGGETEWADMRTAFDALDEDMKAYLEGKEAVHSFVFSHTWHGGQELLAEEDIAGLPPVEHSIVKVHPATGRRSLFVGRHASHIIGEPVAESRELLAALTRQACQPPRTFKHRWRVGDLALWDNRCVLHRGHPWPMDQARDMVRTTVAGDDPDNEWAEDAAPGFAG